MRPAVAAVLVLLLTVPAIAEPPHNLRMYSILPDDADLVIDDGVAEKIGAGTVNFYRLDSGQHSFKITTSSGETISLDANLADDAMATSRGRSWWCVMTGRTTNTNELRLLLDSQEQCQSMLAAAPDNDDPSDSAK